jgi:hypothetical protein
MASITRVEFSVGLGLKVSVMLPAPICLRPASGGFPWQIPSMRKHTINTAESNPPRTSEEWLNLEEIAQVEVSSEDPKYPIELAFMRGEFLGWRASQPGKQTIRLLFDEPKDLRRIWLRFTELQG